MRNAWTEAPSIRAMERDRDDLNREACDLAELERLIEHGEGTPPAGYKTEARRATAEPRDDARKEGTA